MVLNCIYSTPILLPIYLRDAEWWGSDGRVNSLVNFLKASIKFY